jgi:transcriptional regulator with XRE-family HTH domain
VTANITKNAVIFDTKVMALENNPEFLKAFGGRVKALRLERGLGLRKMADMMNIENRQLARIENAEINTSILTAYWIAKVLDVPLPELFAFDEAR